MANSKRQQITDAIVAALQANTTGIAYVSQKTELWNEMQDNHFPAVIVHTDEEERSRFAFLHPTAEDMHARMKLTFVGYTKTANNPDATVLETQGENLIRDIETTLVASTALDDLTFELVPVSFRTDSGAVPNYTMVHYEWMVRYVYNHATP